MRPLAEQLVGEIAVDRAASVDEATDALDASCSAPATRCWSRRRNSVGLAKLVERVREGERACST